MTCTTAFRSVGLDRRVGRNGDDFVGDVHVLSPASDGGSTITGYTVFCCLETAVPE